MKVSPVCVVLLGLFLAGLPMGGLASVEPSLDTPGPWGKDALDLLPHSLASAVREPSPMGFHEAQVALLRQEGPRMSAASVSAPHSTSPDRVPMDPGPRALVEMLLKRLEVDLEEQKASHLDQFLSGLDSVQQRILARVVGAYLEALDAPDPLAARAPFARLAGDPVLASRVREGPLLLDECGLVYLDFSHTPDVHDCDYLLMLDAGGDDVYLNNAGGTIRAKSAVPLPALAVDLGGNDRFEGGVDSGGVAGGGHGNAAALISVAGDDVFDTRAFDGATNGGGLRGGVGLLVDLAGDDEYVGTAAHGGVNGGGGFGGAGLLVDLEGNDTFYGHVQSFGGVNGGSNDGAGALMDLGRGSDRYDGIVGGRGGVNAGNEQGIAFLYDDGGDDAFDGHVSGGGVNGGAIGKGIAYFVSGGGDNVFNGSIGRHGGVNGGAYQATVLFLSLGGGDDLYHGTAWKVGAINAGAVLGQALLVDDGGDDRYQGHIRGTGAVNGAALWGRGGLYDRAGDDVYTAKVLEEDVEELMGEAAGVTNGGALLASGALVDHGGRDGYREGDGAMVWEETRVPKGSFGMQLDLEGAEL